MTTTAKEFFVVSAGMHDDFCYIGFFENDEEAWKCAIRLYGEKQAKEDRRVEKRMLNADTFLDENGLTMFTFRITKVEGKGEKRKLSTDSQFQVTDVDQIYDHEKSDPEINITAGFLNNEIFVKCKAESYDNAVEKIKKFFESEKE